LNNFLAISGRAQSRLALDELLRHRVGLNTTLENAGDERLTEGGRLGDRDQNIPSTVPALGVEEDLKRSFIRTTPFEGIRRTFASEMGRWHPILLDANVCLHLYNVGSGFVALSELVCGRRWRAGEQEARFVERERCTELVDVGAELKKRVVEGLRDGGERRGFEMCLDKGDRSVDGTLRACAKRRRFVRRRIGGRATRLRLTPLLQRAIVSTGGGVHRDC